MNQSPKSAQSQSAKSDKLTRAWYGKALWLYVLLPLSLIYFLLIIVRRFLYRVGVFKSFRAKLPVIVVGNITLGGTGKSPVTSYLVSQLRKAGFKPGIVSRGYGSNLKADECREVLLTSSPELVGDEPLMLKQMQGCPVYVSPTRRLAVEALEQTDCDVVICDDGLQHYALARDIEVCVFDGQRGVGNGMVLPTGPLRESAARLESVDYSIINGADSVSGAKRIGRTFRMDLVAQGARGVSDNRESSLEAFCGKTVYAVAAIGNPDRFFKMLESKGIIVRPYAFEDHHDFSREDFCFPEALPIIMTEKDAVKCRDMSLENAWYIPVSAEIDEEFVRLIINQLNKIKV